MALPVVQVPQMGSVFKKLDICYMWDSLGLFHRYSYVESCISSNPESKNPEIAMVNLDQSVFLGCYNAYKLSQRMPSKHYQCFRIELNFPWYKPRRWMTMWTRLYPTMGDRKKNKAALTLGLCLRDLLCQAMMAETSIALKGWRTFQYYLWIILSSKMKW